MNSNHQRTVFHHYLLIYLMQNYKAQIFMILKLNLQQIN